MLNVMCSLFALVISGIPLLSFGDSERIYVVAQSSFG